MAKNEASKFEELRKAINPRWKIYVDTCSLYAATESGGRFWDAFVPLLQENGCKFIITIGTFEEIKKHKHDVKGKNPGLAKTAQDLEQILRQFSKKNLDLMVTVGKQGEFHDQAIQAKLRERATSFNQVYITNDLANAWDVYNAIHNSRSVTRDLKKLYIYKITKSGDLVSYDQLQYLCELNQKEIDEYFSLWSKRECKQADEYLEARTDYRPWHTRQKARSAKVNSQALSKAEEQGEPQAAVEFQEPVIRSILNPDYNMPVTGSKLRAVRGDKVVSISLGSKLVNGRGGEGIVYNVESGDAVAEEYVAKIYKKSKLFKSMEIANQTMLKINYIVGSGFHSRPVNKGEGLLGDRVHFPLFVLVNEDDEFVGYLMKRAKGCQLSGFVANGAVESEFRRLYPGITKTDLVDICLSFLKAIRDLHSQKIIVGDLNANNILVDIDAKEVALIDADSYQYADKFPCNVGVEKYTSPEFLKNHDTNFRTQQNELFVVARILCEILMMVDNPYNSTVAENPITDMLNGQFRYTFEFLGTGERISNIEAPGKDLEIRWGQLTRTIKNAFGNTFHCKGKFWEPGDRRSATKWIHYLEEYKAEIQDSVRSGDGVVSNDVFPKERRKWITHVQCQICGKSGDQEPNEFKAIVYPKIPNAKLGELARNYHFDCYCEKEGLVDIKCSKCGEDMGVGAPRRKDGKDYICKACWEKRPCKSCGEEFAKWMLDDNGRCRKCASNVKVKCKECGRLIPAWVYEKNGGICDRCKDSMACISCGFKIPKKDWLAQGGLCRKCMNSADTYCGCCGAYMGKLERRTDGKNYYCDSCWKPAKCKKCGWDNHGKLKRWMLDRNGYCKRCASSYNSSQPSAASSYKSSSSSARAQTAQQARPVKQQEPPRKKSFLERLFGL